MIYHASNAAGATVYDMDAKAKIDHVMSIDTDTGWVRVAEQPFRVDADGHIADRAMWFASVHPIPGQGHWPVLFHCYGRKDGPMQART